ncbi:MAG: polysaccharide deacetylase family protein [Planctomycetota bacterium]
MPPTHRQLEPPAQTIEVPPDFPATLLALIHTEEEFDWSQGFDRSATSTRTLEALGPAHRLFVDEGVKPTYVVDWPVIQDDAATPRFAEWARAGTAEIGAHLHPWVNPPHEEEVGEFTSFGGNLDPALERAKLTALTEQITSKLGRAPRTFLAGRYGLGPSTPTILEDLGYTVDASVTPPFDFRRSGGPNFSRFPAAPFVWPQTRSLIEIPITGGYFGRARAVAPGIYPQLKTRLGLALRLEGILSHSGLMTRARLSPEGYGFDDLVALTRQMWSEGTRIFTFSLHSTAFTPGWTDYVPDAASLERFNDLCARYLAWFRAEYGGRPVSHADVGEELRSLPTTRSAPQ